MSKSLKIAFAGTPELAAVILETLLQDKNLEIVRIYTQPDRKAGRGRKISKSAVKQIAENYSVEVRQPDKAKEIDADGLLASLDVLVVAAYGMLLPKELLQKPKFGCINVHTSLLPRWRGAAPIQRAIEAGDTKTGVSIMQMDAGLDTGDVLLQKSCDIAPGETAQTLHDKLAELGAEALTETLSLLRAGSIKARAQDDSQSTYAEKIHKQDAEIDWHLSALDIERKVRAFNPYPVCFTTLNELALRVHEAELVTDSETHEEVGCVIRSDKNGIVVTTGKGLLRIRSMQLPGKKIIDSVAFHNAHPQFCPAT